MQANEYQQKAHEFAIKDDSIAPRYYHWFLGLVEEVTEASFATRPELRGELGDIWWYVANLALDLGIHMSEIVPDGILQTQNKAEMLLRQNVEYPPSSYLVRASHTVGKIAQHLKRRDWDHYKQVEKQALIDMLELLCWQLFRAAAALGVSTEVILQANIDKLSNSHPRSAYLGQTDAGNN